MSLEILSSEQLEQLTGKKRYSAQVAWFKENFGVEPVRRADGSIVMTQSVFEAILMKKMRLAPTPINASDIERPKLRPAVPNRR